MAPDQLYTYATAAIIVGWIVFQACRKDFDPFAPIWVFLAGYFLIYVIQPISFRDYGLRARGPEIVTTAAIRALWALLWFMAVYYSGLARLFAGRLPAAPRGWSVPLVSGISPVLIVWGLICSGLLLSGPRADEVSEEENLLRQFPIVMLVAANLMIVTGRQPDRPRPMFTTLGILTALAYAAIWIYNGKRSHAVFGLQTALCSYYVPRFRRPSLAVLGVSGACCVIAVALAIGWRSNYQYERDLGGFVQYLSDFDPQKALVVLNVKERSDVAPESKEALSKETEEWGGYLLMLATVPALSDYDYGSVYNRLWATYIPRIVWGDKPYYGRAEWLSAWQIGSEFPREPWFTGPAIGLLGAAQLNGGAIGTLIVVGVLALIMRTGYDYFRYHADCPWAQAWWALTYYNAWLTTANDNPAVWFYYVYGHTTLPPLIFFWVANRVLHGSAAKHEARVSAAAMQGA